MDGAYLPVLPYCGGLPADAGAGAAGAEIEVSMPAGGLAARELGSSKMRACLLAGQPIVAIVAVATNAASN